MQTFCQEHNIVFTSQRTETVASIKTISSSMSKESVLCKVNDWQINALTFYMKNFAREHYNRILNFAVELCECLGFKKTAEFLSIVQFVANYVEQVVAVMEEKYQADLQAAQRSQGQNFNREQFDYEYLIQGNRRENFIRCVLTTYELLPKLKAAYLLIFPSKAKPSDSEGNAEDESVATENKSCAFPHTKSDSSSDNMTDTSPELCQSDHSFDSNLDGEGECVRTDVSSVTDVCSTDETAGADEEADVLYKQHRDFEKYGDLSDNEIYVLVQEVTGLYLYEGNTRLYQCDGATFVTVTDPHIIPLTVVIYSDKVNRIVTAGLVM